MNMVYIVKMEQVFDNKNVFDNIFEVCGVYKSLTSAINKITDLYNGVVENGKHEIINHLAMRNGESEFYFKGKESNIVISYEVMEVME